MKIISTTLTVATLLLILVAPARATLLTIGTANYEGNSYNLIYDSGSPMGSVVWLDYTQGSRTWSNQTIWASGLNGAGVLTYTLKPGYSINWTGDWRLPTTVDGVYNFGYNGTTTAGYNVTNSELGHLYYTELGNTGFQDINGAFQNGYGLTQTGDFHNLISNWYWSGTESVEAPGTAWYFTNLYGYQSRNYESEYYFGLADRSGQVVEVAPVPEPSTFILFGAGIAAVAFLRRRKQA